MIRRKKILYKNIFFQKKIMLKKKIIEKKANRNSNLCQIYRKRLIIIEIYFGLTRLKNDFSMCTLKPYGYNAFHLLELVSYVDFPWCMSYIYIYKHICVYICLYTYMYVLRIFPFQIMFVSFPLHDNYRL